MRSYVRADRTEGLSGSERLPFLSMRSSARQAPSRVAPPALNLTPRPSRYNNTEP